jgi:hypothetical protein
VAFLALLTVFLVGQVLSGQWMLLDRELDFLHFRHFEHCREHLSKGAVPLWTPRTFFGFPLLANIQLGLCYPPNWLAMTVLPTQPGIAFLVTFHLFLSAAFTYGFARSLGGQKSGCVVAGATFAFSGFVVSKIVELMTISTLPWLPAILWAMEHWFQRRRPLSLVLAGSAFGLQCLAGHTQYAYYSALTVGVYGLFHVVRSPGKRSEATRMSLAALSAVAAAGIGLFAVQLLPTYELTGVASRAELSFEKAAFGIGNVLTLPLLVQSFLPHFERISYGTGVTLFLGFLWPMLVVLGLRFRPRDRAAFFGCLALVSLLLAAGGQLPLFKLLYDSPLPGFSLFHDPIRIAYVGTLAVAILAGMGTDGLAQDSVPGLSRIKKLFLVSCVVLLLLGIVLGLLRRKEGTAGVFGLVDLAGLLTAASVASCAVFLTRNSTRYRPVAIRLVIGMQILPLLLANMPFVPAVRKKDSQELTEWEPYLAERLRRHAKQPFRVLDLTPDPLQQARWVRHGLDSCSGFSSLVTKQVLEFTSLKDEPASPTQQCSYANFLSSVPFLVAANCRYLIVPKEGNIGMVTAFLERDLQEALKTTAPLVKPVRVMVESPWELYEIDIPSTRLWFLAEARFVEDPDEAFKLLSQSSAKATELILTGHKATDEDFLFVSAATGFEGRPSAPLVSGSPCEIAVEIRCGPGWLFLSQQHFPGWRAFADGESVPIRPAQYLFQAVRFGRETQNVLLVYEPRSFRIGLFLSLFSAGVLAAVVSAIAGSPWLLKTGWLSGVWPDSLHREAQAAP